jgi:cell division protein FtsL
VRRGFEIAKTMRKNEDRILWTGGSSKIRPKRIRSNLLIFFIFLMFFFLGGSLFYVWSRIQVIRLGYEISNALKEERALTEANKKVRVEIATLKSYARIEKFAMEELKMAKPKPEQVIVIR